MKQDEPTAAGADLPLLCAVLALLALGVVMVYSASAVFADTSYGSQVYFLRRHVIYLALGGCAMWVGARLDYSVWRRLAAPLLFASVALLVLCLIPGVATSTKGATRWLRIGGLTFQPSEMAKFALVAFLASLLARRTEVGRRADDAPAPSRPSLYALAGPLVATGAVVLLVLLQPDLGTAVVLSTVALALLFAAGAPVSYLFIGVLAILPIAYQKLIVGTPWRLARVLAFLDPWGMRKTVGYQISESLIAVGSGGPTGAGLGDGKQKLFFLPEAHTDFVLASVGEELGLVGISLVVLCFAVLLWRAVRAALRARDAFGAYLAFGLATTLLTGALIHMGVVLGLLPTKGITLPFVSYGGSALVTAMAMAGVLLNVASGRPEPAGLRLARGGSEAGNRRLRPRRSGELAAVAGPPSDE